MKSLKEYITESLDEDMEHVFAEPGHEKPINMYFTKDELNKILSALAGKYNEIATKIKSKLGVN